MSKHLSKNNLSFYFKKVVENNPNKIAIKSTSFGKLSYRELDEYSNSCALQLLSFRKNKNDMLCISGTKFNSTFCYMLAAIKIGMPYAILDPENPTDRLEKIISRCAPRIILVDNSLKNKISSFVSLKPDIYLVELPRNIKECKISRTKTLEGSSEPDGSTPAYIMFTSGSTGFPKGAVIPHENVVNFINWCKEEFSITSEDVLTNVNPLYFDNSVFDFYVSLWSGATLVPIEKELTIIPKGLIQELDLQKCTSWFSTPSLLVYLSTMKVLNAQNLTHLKRFIFGGEGYPKPKLKQLFDLYSHRIKFFNVYGPTETTCICSSYVVSAKDFKDTTGFCPLGEMAKIFDYKILNENLTLAHTGETGELFLLGPNVGKGYYNDQEISQKVFIQDPTQNLKAQIGYKTGDLVSLNPQDGLIYFKGRADHQIKHMGYRIELEEIEAAINEISLVNEVAVVHCLKNGLSQIIASISTKAVLEEQDIINSLKIALPTYMIPTRFEFLETLPKNQNGKIDRKQLREIYAS